MVDVSDVIIAVWDGNEARGLGGTADVVELTRRREMPLIWIHSDTGEVREERMEKFAAADDKGCAVMAHLARHVKHCLPKARNASDAARMLDFPVSIDVATQAMSDTAKGMADDFRDTQKWIILGHGGATAVAALSAALAEYQGYCWLKLVLVGLALVEALLVARAYLRYRRLHKGEVHEAWMECRFASEIIRGLKDAGKMLDPLSPLIARHHPQWRRFATSAALELYRNDGTQKDWQVQRDEYVDRRLLGPRGQATHFKEKQAEAERRLKKMAGLVTVFSKATIGFVLLAVFYKAGKLLGMEMKDPWLKAITVFSFVLLPIWLPLGVSVFISLRNAMDAGRRTYRYAEMVERLNEAATHLRTLKTASSTRRAVAATEEILIDELNEWHLAEKQNEAH